MINPQKAVQWYRDNNSSSGESDYDIYERLKKWYPQHDYAENPFTTQTPKQEITPTKEEVEEKANPGFFKKLLTSGLAEAYAEESDWWAEAYNKSMAGTLHQLMHGEAKYQVDEVEREWYDEVGQFFVGLISPIDVLTFFGSSGVGSVAAKSITHGPLKNYALKGAAKMMKNAGVKRGVRKNVLEKGLHKYLASGAAIESGFSLATYGAAGATIQDQAQQSIEIKNGTRDERDYMQTIWAATKHGASSLALGSAAGYVTKGLMAPKFAQAKMAKDPTFANKVTKATMNPVGQVVAEGSLFGTGQIAERALMGEDVDMDDWLSSIFMNTGIVGGLRASMKPLRIGQNDVTRYEKAYAQFFGGLYNKKTKQYEGGFYSDINNKKVQSKVAKEYEALKSIEKGYEESGIPTPPEVIEKIATLETQSDMATQAIKAFGGNLKEYNKLLSDMENISKLSPEEQVKVRAKILKESGAMNNTLYHFYTEMQADREFGYQVYKDSFKGKVTDKKKKEIDNYVDQMVKDLEDVNGMLNGAVTGDPNAIKLAQDKYIGGFEVSAKEVKNKKGEVTGYETILETPEGSKVSLPKAARIKKTEAEALKVGEELKETYVKRLKGEDKEVTPTEAKETAVEPSAEVEYQIVKKQYVGFQSPGKKPDAGGTRDITQHQKVRKAKAKDFHVDENTGKTTLYIDGKWQEVRPVKPIEKISDPTKITEGFITKEIKKGLEAIPQPESADVPMLKSKLTQKRVETENLINEVKRTDNKGKEVPFTGPEKTFIKWKNEKPSTGKPESLIQQALKNVNEFDKMAFIDYIKTRLAGNIGKAEPELSGVIKGSGRKNINEVAKFLSDFQKKGKDVSQLEITDLKEFFDKYIPHRTSNRPSNEMSLFMEFLVREKYIDSTKGLNLKDYAKGIVTEYNEWNASGKNKNAPKQGIRKGAVDSAVKSGDVGAEIAAKLGAGFYIRNSEINKIAKMLKKNPEKLNDILILDKKTGEYYLSLDRDLAKYKTFSRYVWVNKGLAGDITAYINAGGSLVGKATKVGQLINKNKLSDNPQSAFYDLRRRGKSVDAKLDARDTATEHYMFGHERSRIDRIYNIKTVSEHINLQKELHKKINSPIYDKGGVETKEFRVISKGEVPAPKEVHAARKYELSKRYPELVIDMVKEFKDKAIPEDAVGYLEKVENWTIKVKLGRAPSDTIPHEVGHYVFKLLDAVSKSEAVLPKQAAKTMKLYNQAKKLFVNKDGKFVEENAILMIGKAIDKQLEAPMMSKATGFFKRFNMWLKSIFNKPLSKDEIAYALGARIIKRQGIPEPIKGIDAPKEFRTVKNFKDGKAFTNAINYEVRLASEKFGFKPNELVEFVAKEAGIGNPKKFRISVPKDELSLAYEKKIGELNSFFNVFEGLNMQEYVGKKNIFKKLQVVKEIEDLRMTRNIPFAEQKRLLRDVWGVRDGNIYQASHEKLKAFAEYMRELDAVEKDNISYLTANEISTLNQKSLDTNFYYRAAREGNLIIGTVHSALKTIGLKKLSEKMLNHYVLQESNASGLTKFHDRSYRILGGNPLTRESRLDVIKNKMTMALDNNGEMLLGLMKWNESGKKLPKGEKKRIKDAEAFFRKAINPEWWKTVKESKDGRKYGDGLAKKNKDGSWKYINLNSKEGQIAQEYINNVQKSLGKDKYESALRQGTNEAEFEMLMSKGGIKFIEDGIYMTRVLTDKGKRLLNVEGKARDRAIDRLALDIAYDRAKKKYGKNFTEDKLYEGPEGGTIMDVSRMLAKEQFSDMLHFNPGKISIKYLKNRYSLQDLFIPDTKGKLVRTYEYRFDKTVASYVKGMSKFYATMEMFPQAIANLKRGNGIHKVFKDAEAQIVGGGGSKQLNWAKEVVSKQLGTEKSAEPYEIVYRSLEGMARTVAKLGLSFPTAGGKNLLTGTTQTLFAHRVRSVAGGLGLVLARDAEVYNKALESNAFSVGNVIYEGRTKIDKFLDYTAFKAGFMKPTEKFNRLLAIAASTYDQRRQLKRLSTYKKGDKYYEKALTRLKDFYFLTDKEIAMKKKYPSIADVRKDNSLTSFERAKMMRNIDVIDKKMNTYAHVNTQGSSADLFMPKFAGKEAVKPLTLFKRMAFAATDNTIRNMKIAAKNKDIIRPIMGLTATYFSGAALLGVYSSLLGTSMPKENSDWWIRFKNTMWKGEFLGLMSEAISPYDPSFVDSIHPAIFRTMQSIGLEVNQLVTGTSNFGQFGEGIFNNVSLIANIKKIKNRGNNPLNRYRIRIAKLFQHYKEDTGKPGPEDIKRTELSPYYEDFRNAFYLGTEEEFAKQFYATFFAVAHDRVRQGYSIDYAFKDANSQMKSKLKTLNPNKASLNKSSKAGKMASMLFINWLQDHPDAGDLTNKLFEIEGEYHKKLSKYMSKLGYYAKKFNVMSYYKKYDWNI